MTGLEQYTNAQHAVDKLRVNRSHEHNNTPTFCQVELLEMLISRMNFHWRLKDMDMKRYDTHHNIIVKIRFVSRY